MITKVNLKPKKVGVRPHSDELSWKSNIEEATKLIFIFLVGLSLLLSPLTSSAADFPVKPITLIVPYKAGGGTDTMARILGKAMSKELGQPVVVVNRPGGSGSLGTSALKNSVADGYTILMGDTAPSVWNPLVQNVDFDMADFRYLAAITEYQNALVASSDKPYSTLDELIAYSKKNPGLSCAVMADLDTKIVNKIIEKNQLDWKVMHTSGGAEVMQFLLGGQVDFGYSGGIHNKYPKKMKVLASFNKGRLGAAPNKASVYELGYGLMIPSYIVVMTLANVPDDVAAMLEKAVLKASQTKDFVTIAQERLKAPVIAVNSAQLAEEMPILQKQLKNLVGK